jgi:hypothetical protein
VAWISPQLRTSNDHGFVVVSVSKGDQPDRASLL